jgi:hypothetical protein
MKIFIWEYVSELTDNWHSEGGCTIVAPTLEAARALFKEQCPNQGSCSLLVKEPDFEAEVSAPEPRLFIFPDAGCC